MRPFHEFVSDAANWALSATIKIYLIWILTQFVQVCKDFVNIFKDLLQHRDARVIICCIPLAFILRDSTIPVKLAENAAAIAGTAGTTAVSITNSVTGATVGITNSVTGATAGIPARIVAYITPGRRLANAA